jgi:hypothetical protein
MDVDQVIQQAGPPTLAPELRLPLRYDLVNKIHDYETIAERYGFGDKAGLIRFLQSEPEFSADVGRLRSLLGSDMSAQERCRLKAAIASEELVARIAGIVANPGTTAAAAIDGFKQLNRMAGVDGIPATGKNGEATPGTQFSLTINMPDGRSETITTVVEAPTAIAPPAEDE